ncbi:hypothetical protein [Candidatus Enterococcus mangumiae]|uniref:LXG domain-containing protein n=1 Tax=Candidatus Enterococcus mangumiae TaxID=2230878 RepID=A0ABZ2SWD9_9ENTE|nr:hypothetical protein [Enterococcus sp. DIV1094]MBO0488589.1 hypothetical protein [Enterococcus sp. DIV1094]
MGLIYSASESSNLISNMTTNLSLARTTIDQLRTGSQQIVQAVDGKTLSGAAYQAGKGLFSELIIPTVNRVNNAVQGIQSDLNLYSAAHQIVSSEGYLDEENLSGQIRAKSFAKQSIENNAQTIRHIANISILPGITEMLTDFHRNLMRMSDSLQEDIYKLQRKQQKLNAFNSQTSGLFNNSLLELKLAMQSVLVLNQTTVKADGSYTLPKGVDGSWFEKYKPNGQTLLEESSTNAFLELYGEIEKLVQPLKEGKTDAIKRLEMLVSNYPDALVNKLASNDEFWMLTNYLPSGMKTKLFNCLTKYEMFGKTVAQGKWLPKIDTIGKAYQNFTKFTSPVKTYVSEGLKNSHLIQGAKKWGVAKGLGTAGQVATYAQLGVTFAANAVNEYGKTGSIGKGIIGGGIEVVKSIGPLEGMTLGAAVAGPLGAVIGGGVGLGNKIFQLFKVNAYDNSKDWSYKLYDKATEKVGKGIKQSIDIVKYVFEDIQQPGKTIGRALSVLKMPNVNLGGRII